MKHHGKWKFKRERWWMLWVPKTWILTFTPPLDIPPRMGVDFSMRLPPPLGGPAEFDCEIEFYSLDG